MAMVSLSERPASPARINPLGLGFRPFFLLAATGGIALVGAWLGLWQGALGLASWLDPTGWHRHEMLFGYATAVIAGFLLTATRNWTGRMTLHGAPLGLLALLWLAGRVLPWVGGVPPWLVAAVDLAFLPLLALALAPALLGANSLPNKLLIPLLLAMAVANALTHADQLGLAAGSAGLGSELMLYLVVWLMVFMGGRVIPFFIEKAVSGSAPIRQRWVETAVPVLMVAWLLGIVAGLEGRLAAILAGLLALVHAARLAGMHHPGVWRNPMLWVLFTGYGWLVLGFALVAAYELGWLPRSVAIHALTAGGIGVLTLGMMARVSLGHTGRAMVPAWLTVASFWLVNAAALVRVAGPLLVPQRYGEWIGLSGLLWLLAFGSFTIVYLPILLRGRVDGRPD